MNARVMCNFAATFEVEPKFVEIWDDDEEKNAYQIFVNFDTEEVEIKHYD